MGVAKKFFSGNANASKRVLTNYSASNHFVAIMEFYLEKWIEQKFKDGGSINGPHTRNQAVVLYNTLIIKNKIKDPPSLAASVGWFDKLKKKLGIKHALYQEELSSTDTHAANSFPHLIILSQVLFIINSSNNKYII